MGAALGTGHDRDGVRHALGISVVPSIGSTATSHSGPSPQPTSSPLNSIGRLVLLALADDDDALIEHRC
jgi:hypothetical protein